MSLDIHVRHFDARYRLGSAAGGQRHRLDHVAGTLLGETLPVALRRSGVPDGEIVCVRDLCCRLRLAAHQSDSEVALAWGLSVAGELAAALAAGSDEIVRYRSTLEALEDLVVRAARGDIARAWAWESLGLTEPHPETATPAALGLEALARAPRAAPAILARVAARGLLHRLLSGPPAAWRAVAHAVLRAVGVRMALEIATRQEPASDAGSGPAESVGGGAESRMERVWAASRIVAIWRHDSGRMILDPSRAQSLAVLILAEADRASLLGSHASAIVRRLAGRLGDRAPSAPRTPPAPPPRTAAARAERLRGEGPGTDAGGRELRPARLRTRHGGLLFLLHLVRALDLPTRWQSGALAERTVHWTLHRLGRALTDAAADDAAVLAFAGVDAVSGRIPEGDAGEAERIEIEAAREAIVGELRRRLDDAESAEAEILARVERRDAEVVFEPSAIDVRLSSTELRLEVRRAGLDLDPGWIPWLGIGVRFTYVD